MAAVIVEPLCQGAGGVRIYSADYLSRLKALCEKHDVLFIADEIAVGFGRTGTFFACEQANIDPDITCIGKSLSGGYLPISAAIVKRELYEAFNDAPDDNTFYHGHTFAGNPIAAAAALELLDIYRDENIVAGVAAKGALMAEHLNPLNDLDTVAQVRCLGLIGAVEMNTPDLARAAQSTLMKANILARPLGSVIYLMPPLNMPDDALNTLSATFADAVRQA